MVAISVIMPVYNTEEQFLREAIESILNQTFQDFEFIIVNDGSVDKVEEIILSYNDVRIVYIKNEKNLGVSASANIAMKKAQGDFIARMDSDDVSMPERLQKQYIFMSENPQYQLCATRISVAKGEFCRRNSNPDYLKAKMMLRGNCIIQPTVMFNKAFFAAQDLYYDESMSYGEDWELWFRFSKVGKLTAIPEKLLYYRLHPDQANKIYSDRFYELGKALFEKNISSLGFEFNTESKDLLLNLLNQNYDVQLSLKQFFILTSETFRLLLFVKNSKIVKFKYAVAILFKKLISYAKNSIILKRTDANLQSG